MDMDYDALKALFKTSAAVLDPKGEKMDIKPDTIVTKYGSSAYFRFIELMGAVKKNALPGGNDNDGSGIGSLKHIALDYLSNDAYWFAFDSSMKEDMYGLQYFESQPIMLEGPHVVFKTSEIQYRSDMMFEIGHNDYRGWFGSKGTNAA